PHSWPPPDLCGDALDWLELRAMLGGLRTMDSGWVRARLADEVARATELERLGRWQEALRLDEAIARDYARWPEASGAATQAAATADQRWRLAGQCVPASGERGQTLRNASNTGSDHQRR